MTPPKLCRTCNGFGIAQDDSACPDCSGTGWAGSKDVSAPPNRLRWLYQRWGGITVGAIIVLGLFIVSKYDSHPDYNAIKSADSRRVQAATQRDDQRWLSAHQGIVVSFQPAKPGLNTDSYVTLELGATCTKYEIRIDDDVFARLLKNATNPLQFPDDFVPHKKIAAEINDNAVALAVFQANGEPHHYTGAVVRIIPPESRSSNRKRELAWDFQKLLPNSKITSTPQTEATADVPTYNPLTGKVELKRSTESTPSVLQCADASHPPADDLPHEASEPAWRTKLKPIPEPSTGKAKEK